MSTKRKTREGLDVPSHVMSKRKAKEERARVNALQLLMASARLQASKGNTATGPVLPASTAEVCLPQDTAPCTWCSRQLPAAHLQQCCACADVFCSACTTVDYEERDSRVFCLECKEEREDSSNDCSSTGILWSSHHSYLQPSHHSSVGSAGRGQLLDAACGTTYASPFQQRPSPFQQSHGVSTPFSLHECLSPYGDRYGGAGAIPPAVTPFQKGGKAFSSTGTDHLHMMHRSPLVALACGSLQGSY